MAFCDLQLGSHVESSSCKPRACHQKTGNQQSGSRNKPSTLPSLHDSVHSTLSVRNELVPARPSRTSNRVSDERTDSRDCVTHSHSRSILGLIMGETCDSDGGQRYEASGDEAESGADDDEPRECVYETPEEEDDGSGKAARDENRNTAVS